MKKVKEVMKREGPGADFKLTEVSGEVIFSESCRTGYGSCLVLKVKGVKDNVWWQSQGENPVTIHVGQMLRGFYKSPIGSAMCLEAYELLDRDENVITRGREQCCYFIEED